MDLAKLQELKGKLQQDADLMPVWTYFLDNFGEDPAFIALGDRANHPFVEAVIVQVAKQLFPGALTVSGLLLTRLADQHFLHGGFSVDGRIGGVFYFEDAHLGLIVITDRPPSQEVKFARFSGRPVRRPAEPSQN
jgi:hypothetical protein